METRDARSSSSSLHYRAIDLIAVPTRPDCELISATASTQARIMASADVDLLIACRTFNTLEGHARTICEEAGMTPDQSGPIRGRLEGFARDGFLISKEGLLESCFRRPQSASIPAVTRIAVTTRTRGKSLERCLQSYAENSKKFDRPVRFLVSDGSETTDGQGKVRELLGALKRRCGVEILYGGREEIAAFRASLVQEGISREVLEFALGDPEGCGTESGAARNAILLETLGERFVSVDDDTVCRLSAPPEDGSNQLRLSSEIDPTEAWFYPDRAAAESAAPGVERDFLALHEELLGKDPGALGGGDDVDLDSMDARLLGVLRAGAGRIRVTQNGILGDCAMESPSAWFAWQGRTLERLIRTEARYRSGCASREMIRVARIPTVSNTGSLMTAGAGFDNRDLLPPFMPVLRNQDGLFAATLRKCFESALIGHIPWTTLHAPPESRPFSPEEVWRGPARIRFERVLSACAAGLELGSAKPEGEERLRAVGLHLVEMASLPLRDFEEFVRRILWRQYSRGFDRLESQIEEFQGAAPYFAQDLRLICREILRTIAEREFIVPQDLAHGRTPEQARELSKRLVLRFGQLLQTWPDIVDAAEALRAKGRSLAAPIAPP